MTHTDTVVFIALGILTILATLYALFHKSKTPRP